MLLFQNKVIKSGHVLQLERNLRAICVSFFHCLSAAAAAAVTPHLSGILIPLFRHRETTQRWPDSQIYLLVSEKHVPIYVALLTLICADP